LAESVIAPEAPVRDERIGVNTLVVAWIVLIPAPLARECARMLYPFAALFTPSITACFGARVKSAAVPFTVFAPVARVTVTVPTPRFAIPTTYFFVIVAASESVIVVVPVTSSVRQWSDATAESGVDIARGERSRAVVSCELIASARALIGSASFALIVVPHVIWLLAPWEPSSGGGDAL
jgi:hypothetical protein